MATEVGLPVSGARAPGSSRALHVARVIDDDAFAALADAWNAAACDAALPSIFLQYEWAAAAWSWRRLDSSLDLVCVREGAVVIAVLPLLRPHAAPRTLELLTVPDTQFADLVVAAADARRVAGAIAESLARRGDWDVLRLDYLQPGGAIATALVPALAACGVKVDVVARGVNPWIALDGRWDAYLADRSRRLKKALNLAGNRLRKAGVLKIERIDAGCDAAAHERALEVAIDISARSWKAATGNALDRPGPQAFVRTLSAAARRRGWLALWLLHLDGRPLAMEYQLVGYGCVHALRADFLAECEDLSPGSHLFRHLLEASFGAGLKRYYLGPGDNAYKARWSEHGEPMVRAVAFARTLRGRTAWLVERRIKPPLRHIRDRMQRGGARDFAAT